MSDNTGDNACLSVTLFSLVGARYAEHVSCSKAAQQRADANVPDFDVPAASRPVE